MKYCSKCGAIIDSEAVICPKCGCATGYKYREDNSGIQTAAKVFMVLGCITSAFFYLVPLIWTIPMTIYYFNSTQNGEKVSGGFKICSLLFVNLIAGILMLCDNN